MSGNPFDQFLPPSEDEYDDVPLWLEEGLEHIGIPRDYAQGLVDWFGIINPAQMRDLHLTEENLEEMGMLPVHRRMLIEAIADGTFDEIGEEDEDDESLPWERSDDFERTNYQPYSGPRDFERMLEEAENVLEEADQLLEETKEDDDEAETKEDDDGWVGSNEFERTNYQPPSELDRMDEETFRIMNDARVRGRKGERRLDVYDGLMYTFDEFQRHYRGSISEWVQAGELDLDERREEPISGMALDIRQFISNYGGIENYELGIARRTGERHPWFDAPPVQRNVDEDSGLPTLPDSYTVPSEALIRRVLRDRRNIVRTRLAPNEGLGEPGSFSINDDINTSADRAVERSDAMNEILNGDEWDPDLSWYSDGIDYLDDESSDNDSDDSDDSADERNRYRYYMGISADAARAAGQAARAAIAAVPADDGDEDYDPFGNDEYDSDLDRQLLGED